VLGPTVFPTGCDSPSARSSAPPPVSALIEPIFTAYCTAEQAPVVKEAFRRAYNKISPPCRINVDRGEELLVS